MESAEDRRYLLRSGLGRVVPPAFPGGGRQLALREIRTGSCPAELGCSVILGGTEKQAQATPEHCHFLSMRPADHVHQVGISVASGCFIATTERFCCVSRSSHSKARGRRRNLPPSSSHVWPILRALRKEGFRCSAAVTNRAVAPSFCGLPAVAARASRQRPAALECVPPAASPPASPSQLPTGPPR